MLAHETTPLKSYAVAVLSIAAAVLLRIPLDPVLGDRFPFATLFLAVLVTVWVGGFVPALVATGLGAVASASLLLPPVYSPAVAAREDRIGLLLYAAVGLGITLIGGAMHAARRRAEADSTAAEAQREQLRVTVDSIGDAVITADTHGRITSLNPVAVELTGWPAAEAIGRPLEDVFRLADEETRQPARDPVGLVLRHARPAGLTYHALLSRHGQLRPIDGSTAPIRNRQGTAIGVVFVFRDVEQKRHAEEVRALLAAAVESSDDAIVTKTLDGIITSWNAGAERLFGHSAREAVGRPITMIIPADRQAEETEILAQLAAGKRIEHFETVRVAKDGRTFDVSITVSPVRNQSGRIVGASKVARDVSDRKRAEEALRLADRRKDAFLATLAHELRNPLAPIRNSIEIMKRAKNDALLLGESRTVLDRQVSHLERLVDDLVDIARINRDQLELRRERLELAAMVQHGVEASRPSAEASRIELIVAQPTEPMHVHADPVRLAQVFGNLLNNACRYTAKGGRVWVTVHREGDAGVVSVRDTGCGIPPNMLSSVFDMFFQIGQLPGQTNDGLGVGLTLVRRLVEMHGGMVEAQSEGLGRGSEFVVRIPLLTDIPARTAPATAPVPPEVRTVRHRVLIVDDNVDAAESLSILLRMSGHDTHVAHDGVEAVEAAEAFRPDIALLDIGLPKISGHDVARQIRARGWGKGILLVALTGWGQEEDRRKSSETGFDHHLVKPVDVATLMTLLQ